MKKTLLAVFLFLFISKGFGQQFSQLNTGTLYDSFENPSQRAFIPDTSKKYAFNFLIPNFSGDFYLKGNAQTTLVNRTFGGKYQNSALEIGSGKYNLAKGQGGVYEIMFKVFSSFRGDAEVGFFAESRAEGRGAFTDESVALFNGTGAFPLNIYDNLFNDHFYDQVYNAIGGTYRQQLTDKLIVGGRLSYLMGIFYEKADIYESHVNFDKGNDAATISLVGRHMLSQGPGNFDARSFLPTPRSSGAQVSFGASYRTNDNVIVQGNVKDLGFIHWFNKSSVANFNSTSTATNIYTRGREDSIYNAVDRIFQDGKVEKSFSTATDARFELSATKSYWLDGSQMFRYSPTLVASKELFYNGTTGALVNHFEYDMKYHASVTFAYDNIDLFSIGLQLMYKTANTEFFIGSDRLLQSLTLMRSVNNYPNFTNGSYTGASLYLGFTQKFGPVVEHPMNSSVMETGEKGFLGRLWNRLFKTNR